MVQQTRKFYQYLESNTITSICTDRNGIVWAGSDFGLFKYDPETDRFLPFINPTDLSEIRNIVSVLEDSAQNLWVTTINTVYRINSKRDELKAFGASYGLHKNQPFFMVHNSLGSNGEIYLADQDGYYVFPSQNIKDNGARPVINFTGLKIGDKEWGAATGRILKEPLEKATEIKLSHDQNTFSFDFFAIDFRSPGGVKYLFMLANYDDDWHYTGADHRAYFFNVPPGKYLFKVKAINVEGNYSERSISVIISPPWWRTWWAYTLYAVLFILGSFIMNRFIRNRIIEKEKAKTRERELEQAKEIEKAYHELKLTQAQLIQSEKMASLGELTAGIAHEIQNPLNFVNNFSDVNTELIDEAEREMMKGNIAEAKSILSDVKDNEEKINHHGRRADAIVKGMLQHSRTSSGQKELTDINKLVDEYLRLAFHGFKAKDKSPDVKLESDLDSSVGKVDVVPQDIGRVLLNLINNAFYAVKEKAKQNIAEYQPSVTVKTKKIADRILISVADNGDGIPQKISDKIFQPFFTTKPTGLGTGLGLSLAYDIVRAHRGEIKVETKEGEGSEFILQLPTGENV
jgi:signal transduction histidine kinase